MAILFGPTSSMLDVYKLESIQLTFAAVCNHHFSKLSYYTSAEALHSLKLHTLHDRMRHLDALFLLTFPLVLCVVVSFVITFPARTVREFLLLRTCCLCLDCPPARRATATNVFKSSIYLDNKPCFLIAFRFS